MRVVLVDDHPVIYLGLEKMLQQFPEFEISIARWHRSAEAYLSSTPDGEIDLLLFHHILPDMSGFDFITLLKCTNPQLKCAIYTCHFSQDTILNSIKCKADGIISKNVDAHELVKGLAAIVWKD